MAIIVGRSPDPTTLQGMLDRNGLYLAAASLVVPAVLAIFVVRRVTAGQGQSGRAQALAQGHVQEQGPAHLS